VCVAQAQEQDALSDVDFESDDEEEEEEEQGEEEEEKAGEKDDGDEARPTKRRKA
jgi:hypothetical protein